MLNLVRWADAKVESGAMKKNHLILPGKKRMRKWIINACRVQEGSNEHTPDDSESGFSNVDYGDAFNGSKDPEHLPPTSKLLVKRIFSHEYANRSRCLAETR